MCCLYLQVLNLLMHCYSVHLCQLAIFQSSYFSPSQVCDKNIDHVNGISDSKAVDLSIINSFCLLRFIGTMLFICMVTIFIKTIVNITFLLWLGKHWQQRIRSVFNSLRFLYSYLNLYHHYQDHKLSLSLVLVVLVCQW